MNKEAFEKLDLNGRAEHVWDHGKHISSVNFVAFKLSLYAVEDQLIEVLYNSHMNEIEEVEIIEPDSPNLEFYACPVDMSNLKFNI